MTELKWWQKAVFYQIYPRSFADGNGDGIGDLYGILNRLDYLKEMGIDALWLSPHYPSPLFDCGYDVADYTGVAPEYGDLKLFEEFLHEAHARGIRVILDLVLNHTSHEHAWFRESRSSRDNPKRDWYIWRDGKAGGPPNNWYSAFGGSAWEYDPLTEQYYYHFFLKEQPDLNWRNPEVQEAVFNEVRFWLDMGIDGFRLDAIDTIFEDAALPDQHADYTPEELYRLTNRSVWEEKDPQISEQWRKMYMYQLQQPGTHRLFQDLRALIDEYPDRVLVGETDEVSYYGDGSNELHMTFNFPLMRTDHLTPAWIRANQHERLAALPPGAWPCNTLGNHDSPRVYSRYGDGMHDDEIARLSLALMLTLRGTPFLYNGEEIGMTDYLFTDLERFKDVPALWTYKLHKEILGEAEEQARQSAAQQGRDKCRTPLQWDNAPHGGFCPADVEPWLPVNPNYAEGINVAEQDADPGSLLNFYRRMLRMRQETPALIAGSYIPLHEEAEDYFAFLRETEEQTCLVVLNYSDRAHTLSFDLGEGRVARLIFSNRERLAVEGDLAALDIAPFETYIAEV
ncbi:MAG: alpha-glucosidase [Chloroflexi bacterium]|nr:MAG: alpha-glucosidase [Chloroflexota bacterium]